jgi:Major royal jelly protein
MSTQIDADDNLWFLSNALPIHIYSTLNVTDYNFYIWRMKIDAAIKNTVCHVNRSQQLIFS